MNNTQFKYLNQLNFYVQDSLFPFLESQGIVLTDKLCEVVNAIEISELDKFVVNCSKSHLGRPSLNRIFFARAFIAKAVLNLGTTNHLIERLTYDKTLRRICGFSITHRLPNKSSFSRAFKEFSDYKLPEIVHKAFIQKHLSEMEFETVSHDATAIESREKVKTVKKKKPKNQLLIHKLKIKKLSKRPKREGVRQKKNKH